jgi:hypothetical protein
VIEIISDPGEIRRRKSMGTKAVGPSLWSTTDKALPTLLIYILEILHS